jgi:hypothetical protein
VDNFAKLPQKVTNQLDDGMFQLVYKSSLDRSKSLEGLLEQKDNAIKEIAQSFCTLYNDPKDIKKWIDLNNLIQKCNGI